MSKLSANIDDLEVAIRTLKEVIPAMDQLADDLAKICDELNDSWDGAASEYFIKKLRGFVKPMMETCQVLQGFQDYAQETKEDMERLDAIMKKIQEILSNVVTGPAHAGNSGNSSSSGNSGSSSSSSSSSSSNKKEKSTVEKVIDAVTEPVKNVINGIKKILGGK